MTDSTDELFEEEPSEIGENAGDDTPPANEEGKDKTPDLTAVLMQMDANMKALASEVASLKTQRAPKVDESDEEDDISYDPAAIVNRATQEMQQSSALIDDMADEIADEYPMMPKAAIKELRAALRAQPLKALQQIKKNNQHFDVANSYIGRQVKEGKLLAPGQKPLKATGVGSQVGGGRAGGRVDTIAKDIESKMLGGRPLSKKGRAMLAASMEG